MTLGTWTPDASKPELPDELSLGAALKLGLEQSFPAEPVAGVDALQAWMKQPQNAWQDTWSHYSNEQLQALVRFFTQAEQHWPGWQGDDKNPVIWICKELKHRGAFPDAELTHWIKAHTDNRYLPYGNPLA
ncbi:MAG: hypothetical protein LAT65_08260 [Saccharospirillum sp.]|nr:hypothetical protein [Saccharospirillum sp.]